MEGGDDGSRTNNTKEGDEDGAEVVSVSVFVFLEVRKMWCERGEIKRKKKWEMGNKMI